MIINKILTCGIVPVRYTPEGWKLLVLRAYQHWDFPKGMMEAGEQPLDTAKRETEEETGLNESELDFVWGEDFKETAPYSGNKVARYYIAETREEEITLPVSEELGRPEHDEWRWVTCEEAEDLLRPRLAIVLEWVRTTIDEDSGSGEPEYSQTNIGARSDEDEEEQR